MCKFNCKKTSTIVSYQTHRSFNLIGNTTCHSKNVIYVMSCTLCKLQYVGETSRPVRDRLNDHLSAIKTGKLTRTAIHFKQEDHTRSDIHIIPVEQIIENTQSHTIRRQRESHWISKLCTKYPHGLNGLPLNI